MLAPIGGALLTVLAMFISPSLGSCIGPLVGCGAGCGGLAWWIAGIVWRFRSDGAYAAGDVLPNGKELEAWQTEIEAEGSLFQVKSGKFMFIFYVITWSSMGLCCLCMLVGSIYACVAGPKSID